MKKLCRALAFLFWACYNKRNWIELFIHIFSFLTVMKARIIHTSVVFVVTFFAAALFSSVPGSLSNQCFADDSASEQAEALFQQAQKLRNGEDEPKDVDKVV